MEQFSLTTGSRCQMIDITGQVRDILYKSGCAAGICYVFVSHTTAGITINENADPDVPKDILAALEKLVPEHGSYRHREGNSDAHVKSSLMGSSQTVFIEDGKLVLGTWQSLFFCEFDGPRRRTVWVKIMPAS
ncbi:MAG: secondary thiamine-phosphate synthase enzyme YjbQ [Syntrophobacterales bacterium]|jgi:secondary thiamine-phosphate synthase enzyme|nr:secondary thiamine-phosphate synthase enzyme YjbQ [Syntrophobacterales bacterium]